jgi:hypothetical protein
VDYYILENGVLKKINNLELRIAAKYMAALIFGLIIGCFVFWALSQFGI